MISLARFHSGERIAINPDLIERVEETPDTVVTLTSGAKYVVEESIDEITEKIRSFRASTLALAGHLDVLPPHGTVKLRVVRVVVPGAHPDSRSVRP